MCRGVRVLLLLLTNRPSERSSGGSVGLSSIQEDDSAGANSSFDAAFSESVATASLLLLLLSAETDTDAAGASAGETGEGRKRRHTQMRIGRKLRR